jgi:hypothetical protein
LDDFETQREDHGRQMDDLQQELNRAQVRVEAAEEDAQLALDLAKGNAESREQLETWLQRALQEIEVLRGGAYACAVLPTSPGYADTQQPVKRKPVVRFAESPTIVEMPADDDQALSPKRQASRSMVAAGRHLLHRAIAESTPDNQKMHSVSFTPEKSAERREKLRRRLRSLDSDVDISTPASAQSSSGSAVRGADMGSATKAVESCQSVARVLRESGQRIGLSGQGWDATHRRLDDAHAESMARQFCHTVEVRTTIKSLLRMLVLNIRVAHVCIVVVTYVIPGKIEQAKRRHSRIAGTMRIS